MTVPITVHPRHETAEAMQFIGSVGSAHELSDFVSGGRNSLKDVSVRYTASLNEVSTLELSIGYDEGYELRAGDWIVKDGEGLFSMVRAQDFPLRYVTPIEKIKLEAGMN